MKERGNCTMRTSERDHAQRLGWRRAAQWNPSVRALLATGLRQAPFTTADMDVFNNKRGKVHACVECDFPNEQGPYLPVPLPNPQGDRR